MPTSSGPRRNGSANSYRSDISRRGNSNRRYASSDSRSYSNAGSRGASMRSDSRARYRRPQDRRPSDYWDSNIPFNDDGRRPDAPRPYNKKERSLISRMWERSHGLTVAAFVIAALLIIGLFDFALNDNRIYSGISIGDVDVSGMTAEEASQALSDRYDSGILSSTVYIFPSEAAEAASDINSGSYTDTENNEKYTLEEARDSNLLWIENASNTGARLSTDKMVQEALSLGKDWRFWERISAAVGGYDIQPELEFNQGAIDSLLDSINKAIGTPMVNYGIAIDEGVAQVTEGHDGDLVNSDSIKSDLTQAFLNGENGISTFIAQPEQVLVQIDEALAADTADAVTKAISTGASFIFNDAKVEIDKAELGGWIATDVAETEKGGFYLKPVISSGTAALRLIPMLGFSISDTSMPVAFAKDDQGKVLVTLTEEEMLPSIDDALATLDKGLFNSFRERAIKEEKPSSKSASSTSVASSANVFGIPIEMSMQSGPFVFDEAMALGVITEISSYTTWFYSSPETQNRDHNIELAASLINDSIVAADGGQWSWIETAGACAEEDGFLPAGAIAADEYRQEAGGGICQVATTVFNSVYDAGYNILERHNHTLYMSIYPDGRDAAVTYPMLDLKWQNDTPSDVLLKAWCDGASVTVALYGVDPHYSITTETGEWEEGDDFDIEVKKEGDYLELDETDIKTEGVKGSSITVKRIVKDSQGNIVYTNEFASDYLPVTEVILIHPDSELDEAEVIAEEEKRLKEEAEKKEDD